MESYRLTGKSPSAIDLHRELNALKLLSIEDGGVPWMYESSKCAPQEALRDLDVAYAAFFRRVKSNAPRKGFPKFKARRPGEGHFRLTGTIRLTETHLQLSRVGKVRIAPGDRRYAASGEYSSVSVTQEHGEWFAAIRFTVAEHEPVSEDAPAEVGIDLGVRKLAVLATPDGTVEVVPNLRALSYSTRQLRVQQERVSRRKKGSGRRRRAVRDLGRIHQRVANIRRDMTHKATTAIADRFRVVAMGALRLRTIAERVAVEERGQLREPRRVH